MRAVVFHQGALGDFLMAASAIDGLVENHCLARVDFWSKPEHVSLLSQKSYLGKCYSIDTSLTARLLEDSLWRTAALPDFLLEADRLLIFGQTGSRLMAERLSARLRASVNWIQSFPQTGDDVIHVSHFLRKQLNCLGLPPGGKPIVLTPPDSEKMAARDLLHELGIHSKPIFIHPGSGGRRKTWPLRNWHGLLQWVRRTLSTQAILSIGPADGYLNEFAEAMGKAGVSIVTGLSLPRLSALLSICSLYIGSDSGVSHLAAAVGIPTVVVFGPTDPRVWAPQGENVTGLCRIWKEEDVLGWSPLDNPDFQEKEIADIFTNQDLL
jgi:heptosyltransferase III